MNNRWKGALALIMALALCLAPAGCGGPREEPAEESPTAAVSPTPSESEWTVGKKGLLIGFSQPYVDNYGRRLADCMTAACDHYEMEILCADAEGSAEKQISQVKDMVSAGCDLIFIRALDADALAPAAEYCRDNGVPCVGAELDVNSDACLSHFLHPETSLGQGAGKAAAALLEADPDLVLKLGHIWGSAARAAEQERWEGFTDALEEYMDSGRVIVLDEQEAGDNPAGAATITGRWLRAMPEMNCIFGNSDALAYVAAGVASANDYKMNEEFWVLGAGGDPEGFAGLEEGIMYATSVDADMQDRQQYWMGMVYDYLVEGVEPDRSYTWTAQAATVTVTDMEESAPQE